MDVKRARACEARRRAPTGTGEAKRAGGAASGGAGIGVRQEPHCWIAWRTRVAAASRKGQAAHVQRRPGFTRESRANGRERERRRMGAGESGEWIVPWGTARARGRIAGEPAVAEARSGRWRRRRLPPKRGSHPGHTFFMACGRPLRIRSSRRRCPAAVRRRGRDAPTATRNALPPFPAASCRAFDCPFKAGRSRCGAVVCLSGRGRPPRAVP